MHLRIFDARLSHRKHCIGCFEHGFINHALNVRELAVDRQSASDVGCIKTVNFNTGVKQQQFARFDLAVVRNPVQRAGVLTGGGDSFVTKVVAVSSCLSKESTFNNALTARVLSCLAQIANNCLETLDRCINSFLHLFDFVAVFN